MKLFHASDTLIEKPDIFHSRHNLDFGVGFYLTQMEDQAVKYARRFTALGKTAYIHTYEFNLYPQFKTLTFDSYSADWLKFVCNCRSGEKDYAAFDIIEGGVANDKVFRTVELFMSGIYTAEQALQQLIYQKPNHQVCFVNQDAIDTCLEFIGCYKIKPEANGED